jgi:hypothetical protein
MFSKVDNVFVKLLTNPVQRWCNCWGFNEKEIIKNVTYSHRGGSSLKSDRGSIILAMLGGPGACPPRKIFEI